MSLTSSGTTQLRAGAATNVRSARAALLGSVCFAATNLVIATGASAQNVATVDFPGFIVGNSPAFIWVQPGLTGNTVIDVNTDNIVGPNIDGIYVPGAATLSSGTIDITVGAGLSVAGARNGIWATSSQPTGDITATINGAVTGGVNGVILNPGFGALFTGGTATLDGTGTIAATTGYGAWLLNNNAPIIIDGPSSITSGLSGIVTQSLGANATATTLISNVGTVEGTAVNAGVKLGHYGGVKLGQWL